ncbi:7908_t:CDS:2 [Entrophospora sp. SA101]|nr:7908_t:CDS:2 [Entrophospora sp. SA101]
MSGVFDLLQVFEDVMFFAMRLMKRCDVVKDVVPNESLLLLLLGLALVLFNDLTTVYLYRVYFGRLPPLLPTIV